MKRIVCAAASLMFIAAGSAAFAQDLSLARSVSPKSSWYIGFGLGSGNGQWSIIGQNVTFDDWSTGLSDTMKLTGEFGVGAVVSPNWCFGGMVSFLSCQGKYAGERYNAQMNNYLLVATWYPMEDGFFLRGGIGYAGFVIDTPYGDNVTNGLGMLAGLGYDLKIGSTFHLGVHLDYSYQNYSDADGKPDDGQFWNINAAFYWF